MTVRSWRIIERFFRLADTTASRNLAFRVVIRKDGDAGCPFWLGPAHRKLTEEQIRRHVRGWNAAYVVKVKPKRYRTIPGLFTEAKK